MTTLQNAVPRYTSYPTAPHFSPGVDSQRYAQWLAALPPGSNISLYVHIAFCHQICWYCGCNTKATQQYAPVARYLKSIKAELARVAAQIPAHSVTTLHWGGGSPNILSAEDISALHETIRTHFDMAQKVEFAVEIDPRHLARDQVAAFARAGLTRLSLGVQDFNETVQAAVGRAQSFEMTQRAVDAFRGHGIGSINIDLMYGLPHQTTETVTRTAEQVLALSPDRIAVFGYAHLPQRMKNQRLVPEAHLPSTAERMAQSTRIGEILVAHGYVRVGFDHYAKPTDKLAGGNIARNFQGFTTDRSNALIGIGASAIGKLPQGYVQNAVAAADYERRLGAGDLATIKGVAFTDEDLARGYVIERLMCDLRFSIADVRRRFGASLDGIVADADRLLALDSNGDFVRRSPDGFHVTERGRPFLRNICAHFDAYLRNSNALHSAAV